MQQDELKTFNQKSNKLNNELIEQNCYYFYYSDKIKYCLLKKGREKGCF